MWVVSLIDSGKNKTLCRSVIYEFDPLPLQKKGGGGAWGA